MIGKKSEEGWRWVLTMTNTTAWSTQTAQGKSLAYIPGYKMVSSLFYTLCLHSLGLKAFFFYCSTYFYLLLIKYHGVIIVIVG